ncbi:DUF4846 domain-containing protein [Chitinophaga sp.]|uniref:DUF4846 domain-containing protein n=1 Tax=Chitinophaga sp. TaxID=1869181 RepID=UPI002BA6289E|nr:DUF4846 domain-containing protein [Chitinophaga sp.]HWV67662.1 DUF4846 domain-containing protein [Chitinophaga sp.]
MINARKLTVLLAAILTFAGSFVYAWQYDATAMAPPRIEPPFSNATYPSAVVGALPLPPGFTRLPQPAGSFGAWLRSIPLKRDNRVYLYNGHLKNNQEAQYAVLDISTGSKDLQQCADAVIRLYAEYLYSSRQFNKIAFHATDGTLMDYTSWMKGYRFVLKQNRLIKVRKAAPCSGQDCFSNYLETVFSWAGTLSLSKELLPVTDTRKILPGNVFIKGGAPGHAVIVMDVAQNAAGERIFLLAQSYMPAQDIHVLKNPAGATPWYNAGFTGKLLTPEWVFDAGELSRFL